MNKAEKLKRFQELLERTNKKINLVSRRLTRADLEKHVEDCLEFAKYWDASGRLVADIGSGGGLPGIVLAIVFPEGMFNLIESDGKKSSFLMMAAEELGLRNVQVVTRRVEMVARDEEYRGRHDFATVRAVASLSVVVEYGLPLLRVGGLLVCWKGRNCDVEIQQAERALVETGGRLEERKGYFLVGSQRYLLAIRKVRETPLIYPRRVGVPEKRPL